MQRSADGEEKEPECKEERRRGKNGRERENGGEEKERRKEDKGMKLLACRGPWKRRPHERAAKKSRRERKRIW